MTHSDPDYLVRLDPGMTNLWEKRFINCRDEGFTGTRYVDGLAIDAARRFASYPVMVHTNAVIKKVSARSVLLEDGEILSADLCIW